MHKKHNIVLSKNELDFIIDNINTAGKPHIAKLMLDKGIVSEVEEAFQKYLNNIDTSISYRIDALKVIKEIKKANGIAILAHPKKIENEYNIDLVNILPSLLEIGLDGIEVLNTIHSLDDAEKYMNLVKNYKLLATGGSDFHGDNIKPNAKLGILLNTYINNTNLTIIEHEISKSLQESVNNFV